MQQIDHVVVLMMENRSFDHVLGALRLEGRSDIDGITLPPRSCLKADGTPVSQWNMDTTDHNFTIPHDRQTVVAQYAAGAMTGFVSAVQAKDPSADPARPMGYYTRRTFPVLYALADEFAVCNSWYSAMLSSTWPNRKYFHSGTRDQDDDTQVIPGFPGFRTTPLYSALERTPDPKRSGHTLTWQCYFSDLPFLAFWYEFAATHALTNFSLVSQFPDDCRAGSLPHVSIIDPPFSLADDHPPHDPALGEKFIGLIVDALTTSPSWHNSVLLILFDEHGGFYDHAVPPGAPPNPLDDTPLGIRVPALVISPSAKKGVSNTPYEHTSFMKSLNERWQIAFDPALRWAAAKDFWDCLDATASPRPCGIYSGVDTASTVAGMNWGSGVYDRLGGELNSFESFLERIFVIPELKTLDARASVFDTLMSFEHKVIMQKRMSKYSP